MKTLKITNEKWLVKSSYSSGNHEIECEGVVIATAHYTQGVSMKQAAENAQLIAEAGTVANETGLTPRQILEQRNELLEVITYVRTQMEAHTSIRHNSHAIAKRCADAIKNTTK